MVALTFLDYDTHFRKADAQKKSEVGEGDVHSLMMRKEEEEEERTMTKKVVQDNVFSMSTVDIYHRRLCLCKTKVVVDTASKREIHDRIDDGRMNLVYC